MQPVQLLLEDGRAFQGKGCPGPRDIAFGEAVFTTGMVGYPEALTDPSYTGQLLCFTYPLIGNYGSPSPEAWESTRIHLAGIIVSQLAERWSHRTALTGMRAWLERHQLPYITGIDTRALTLHLRTAGTMPAAIVAEGRKPDHFPNLLSEHLVERASIDEPVCVGEGSKTVIAVDCGMKQNIVRSLVRLGVTIKRVPHDYDYSEEAFDGLFLSNGPGNPETCTTTIDILRKAMRREKPIFGICLGTQLLALAAGATTYKLPYGHRGHNQPCMELATRHCYMTSQNHGFAVDQESLPEGWSVTYRNLNDNSVEGIAHDTLPFSAVQFHPEACPGPTDTTELFTRFVRQL